LPFIVLVGRKSSVKFVLFGVLYSLHYSVKWGQKSSTQSL